ncbi:MAG: hypothetical protein ACOC1K_01090 [Nanoarchaeota archaeon]
MKNEIKEIDLTSKEIENQIKEYNLEFLSIRRNDIEWKYSFPIFVTAFYDLVKENNQIPTQSYFFDFYLDKFSENSQISELNENQLGALKARIYRAYPSYVRDIHFSNLVYEKGNFNKVIYNLDLDIKEGVDILVIENDKKYAVNLFTDTRRSKKARKIKIDRHDDIDKYIQIDLPISFWDCKEIGEFYLYSEKDIDKIREVI